MPLERLGAQLVQEHDRHTNIHAIAARARGIERITQLKREIIIHTPLLRVRIVIKLFTIGLQKLLRIEIQQVRILAAGPLPPTVQSPLIRNMRGDALIIEIKKRMIISQ